MPETYECEECGYVMNNPCEQRPLLFCIKCDSKKIKKIQTDKTVVNTYGVSKQKDGIPK